MIGGENPTNRNEDLSLTVKMLGCCASRNSAKQTNKRINKELKRERNAESKLLLLGKEIFFFIQDYFFLLIQEPETPGKVRLSNRSSEFLIVERRFYKIS
jgi:hypothetical protein